MWRSRWIWWKTRGRQVLEPSLSPVHVHHTPTMRTSSLNAVKGLPSVGLLQPRWAPRMEHQGALLGHASWYSCSTQAREFPWLRALVGLTGRGPSVNKDSWFLIWTLKDIFHCMCLGKGSGLHPCQPLWQVWARTVSDWTQGWERAVWHTYVLPGFWETGDRPWEGSTHHAGSP